MVNLNLEALLLYSDSARAASNRMKHIDQKHLTKFFFLGQDCLWLYSAHTSSDRTTCHYFPPNLEAIYCTLKWRNEPLSIGNHRGSLWGNFPCWQKSSQGRKQRDKLSSASRRVATRATTKGVKSQGYGPRKASPSQRRTVQRLEVRCKQIIAKQVK